MGLIRIDTTAVPCQHIRRWQLKPQVLGSTLVLSCLRTCVQYFRPSVPSYAVRGTLRATRDDWPLDTRLGDVDLCNRGFASVIQSPRVPLTQLAARKKRGAPFPFGICKALENERSTQAHGQQRLGSANLFVTHPMAGGLKDLDYASKLPWPYGIRTAAAGEEHVLTPSRRGIVHC